MNLCTATCSVPADLSHRLPHEAFIDKALELADLNALRLALYQVTHDSSLESMPLVSVAVRGGASWALVPAPQCRDEIRAKAKALLMAGGAEEVPAASISDAELRSLMEMMSGGQPLNDCEFVFHKEQYALHPFPRAAHWSGDEPVQIPEGFRVGIVGAGFNGIATAVQLEQLGIPYVIYEREDEAGGTWHINQYPDARVDTSSFIYQFSFEKRYPWSEYFARGAEVKAYIIHVAKKFDVFSKIRFGRRIASATFDETADIWVLRFGSGDLEPESVNVLVAASGLFAVPKLPDIPGIDEFGGTIVHSTEWSDDIPVEKRRIAVIGNGSTGVQILPRLAADGGEMAVFQRTPQWMSPLENYGVPIPEETRWLLNTMPYYWNWYCYSMVRATFIQQDAQVVDREWQARGGLISQRNDRLRSILTAYVEKRLDGRPDLIAKLLPDYPPLARRLVIDNGWYDALLRDNVELVTDGIETITKDGICTVDGVTRAFDTIVLATGFDTDRYLWPMRVVGRDGLVLEQVWDGDPRAYLGISVPKFPNLYIMYGPNSQPRAGSVVCWFEVWSQHVAQAVVCMLEARATRAEVKQAAFDAHNDAIDAAHADLVWNLGPKGRNYYVNAKGRPQVNSPFRIEEHRAMFQRPIESVYTLSSR